MVEGSRIAAAHLKWGFGLLSQSITLRPPGISSTRFSHKPGLLQVQGVSSEQIFGNR
jgi:hypothetical protein